MVKAGARAGGAASGLNLDLQDEGIARISAARVGRVKTRRGGYWPHAALAGGGIKFTVHIAVLSSAGLMHLR